MKPKRKLKNWVKVSLLLLPDVVIMMQLFLVGKKVKGIRK